MTIGSNWINFISLIFNLTGVFITLWRLIVTRRKIKTPKGKFGLPISSFALDSSDPKTRKLIGRFKQANVTIRDLEKENTFAMIGTCLIIIGIVIQFWTILR